MAELRPAMLLDDDGAVRDRIVGFETEYGFCLQDAGTGTFYEMGDHSYGYGMLNGTDEYDEAGNRMYMDIGPHPELSTAEETSFIGSAHRLLIGHLAMAKFWTQNPPEKIQEFEKVRRPTTVHLLANNVDSRNETWGSHENFLASRELNVDDFVTGLAIHNLSRIVWAGNGTVTHRGRSFRLALSERAEHIWDVEHSGTTSARPLVNLRDEPLARASQFRRIHIISGDSVISPFANALRLASGSIILRACEIGVDFSDLQPVNPPAAMKIISRDPTLQATVKLVGGREFTGLDLQEALIGRSEPELERLNYLSPQEKQWLERWKSVLDDLKTDRTRCLDRVDWILKEALIERQLAQPSSDNRNPALVAQAMAFDFHRLLPHEGMGMQLVRKGFYVDSPTAQILENGLPLPETRAKLRVRLLKKARTSNVLSGASWEELKISSHIEHANLELPDPYQTENPELDEIMDRLIATDDLMDTTSTG